MIVLLPRFRFHLLTQAIPGLRESATLVYDSQLLDNIIMKPVQQYEEYSATGWKAQQSRFRETVRFQFTVLESPHCNLIFFSVAIQCG